MIFLKFIKMVLIFQKFINKSFQKLYVAGFIIDDIIVIKHISNDYYLYKIPNVIILSNVVKRNFNMFK